MTTATTGEITALLRRIEQGDAAAHDQLAQLVRASLKRIAANRLRRERPAHLYQTSDLVHEAYIRLFKMKDAHWEGSEHFFKVAATQMRRILVEYARKEYRFSAAPMKRAARAAPRKQLPAGGKPAGGGAANNNPGNPAPAARWAGGLCPKGWRLPCNGRGTNWKARNDEAANAG
jgi:DNA invertase Pin-like site-specific DNA recombinase